MPESRSVGAGGANAARPKRVARAPRSANAALEERLALYARYASVMAEQEAALEAGDVDGFAALNDQRRQIEAEVDALVVHPPVVPDAETLERVHEAVDALQSVKARQVRMEEKLRSLRSDVGEEIRDVQSRKGPLNAYLKDSARGAVAQPRRLDVTS